MHINFFIFLLSAFGALYSEAYFIPPKGWLAADPAQLSPRVKASFLTKGKREYCPSLNLASEKVALSLDGYMKAVKEAHSHDKNSHWRDLGKFTTQVGDGRLIEIESKTSLGTARLLQFIFVENKVAYVMTASALKEEFAEHMKEFQKAFQSFSIKENLFECIEKKEQREALKKEYEELLVAWQKRESSLESEANNADEDFQKHHFLPFQKKVLEEFSEMGGCWQLLMLQFVQKKFK
ncbi:MAG TPA: hypothetical protein VLG76_00940 [Rhabdochlamydiaceae bacterium]|nr:hypothetical protein [Rhabdochlamydiaceae bacterium]